MRAFVIISMMVAASATQALALTKGELARASIERARTECSEAFSAHEAVWPSPGVALDVVWRRVLSLPSAGEELDPIAPENLPTKERFSAWDMSFIQLTTDFAAVSVLGKSEHPMTPAAREQYDISAKRVDASADIYLCLRPAVDEAWEDYIRKFDEAVEEEIAMLSEEYGDSKRFNRERDRVNAKRDKFVASRARLLEKRGVWLGDCLAKSGKQMASAILGNTDLVIVQSELKSLYAELEECERSNQP